MSTTGPTSAHEQAVAGYDARVGSFSVRDPSRPKLALFDVEALLTSQRWIGPRGLVLLPADRAGAIAGLELPDAALFDLHHAVEQALHRHDRSAAAAAVAELERRAPEHFLAAHAARFWPGTTRTRRRSWRSASASSPVTRTSRRSS
ncbi:hypothetical protein [Nannocystis pusilla]|uniref:hypothetical protein n=1 Tax=Nannocystis pusilla TaxID=889268 RepID=UPI003B7B9BAD